MNVYTSLLNPQHLDGILIEQDQYRLPLAPLVSRTMVLKNVCKGCKENLSLLVVPDMRKKWFVKKKEFFGLQL